jgi:succinoglycan biosynthesis transport protein ExoP
MKQNQMRQRSSSVSAKQLLEALKQHAHIVFLTSLLLAVLGIVGISLLPNVYRAMTTILVDPQKIPEKYVSSTVTTVKRPRLN